MNEADWMTCADPGLMLNACLALTTPGQVGFVVPGRVGNLAYRPSKRKLRLWVEACRRATGRLAPWPNVLPTVAAVERAAHDWCLDSSWGEECPLALRAALMRDLVGNPWRPVTVPYRCRGCGIPCGAPAAGYYCVRCGADEVACPWLTSAVLSLARAAYEQRLPDCRLCKGKGAIDRPVICGPDTSEEEMRRLADEAGGPIPCPSCRGQARSGFLDPARLAVLSDALEEADCQEAAILEHLRSPGPHAVGCWCVDALLGQE